MFVLASNSPRRKALLALSGWQFQVAPAEIDERVLPGETPENYVRRLAEEKARVVAGRQPRDTVIIAADTTVVDPLAEPEKRILGKPENEQEALEMLHRLRGRSHQVITGLAVLRSADGVLLSDTCSTDVKMRPYSQPEMRAYVDSGDPLDKAGAYAIQHTGFHPVESVQGCYANVVGLPLCCLTRLLEKLGISAPPSLPQACQEDLQVECPVYRQILESSPPIEL